MRTTVLSRSHRAPLVHRVGGPGAVPTRPTGGEFRLAAWLCRHPLIALTPVVVIAAMYRFGPPVVGFSLAGVVVALAAGGAGSPTAADAGPGCSPRVS
jgi:hypothetical protein